MVADINGDGKPDFITLNGGFYADQPGVSVIRSTPTGYETGTQIINPLGGPIGMGVGDFTGPGQQDIAIVYDNYSNNEGVSDGDVIQVLQNDGNGNFTAQNPILLNRRDVVSATFGDVNKDGVPDLVLVLSPFVQAGYSSVTQLSVWTFVCDGHGNFTPTTPAPLPLDTTDQSTPTSITLADINGDGYPDLILGSNQFGAVRTAINDGTGTMRPPSQSMPYVGTQNSNGTYTPGVAQQVFADFNNDGVPDFVTISQGGLDVYLGQSDGSFKHTASLPNPLGGPVGWVQVGDLNNDGIPDIVFGGLPATAREWRFTSATATARFARDPRS